MLAIMSLGFAAVIFGLRPLIRPRARAAYNAGSSCAGDELALKRGERGEDAENKLAGGRRCVDRCALVRTRNRMRKSSG